MVKVESSEKNPVKSTLFLNSIRSWYKKDGVKVAVESIGKPYVIENNDDENAKPKTTISVSLYLTDGMDKCRVRVVEDNQYVKVEDDSGNLVYKVEIVDWVEEVPFFFNVAPVDEDKDEYKVFNLSSAFPLFNFAFIQAGDLPEGNKKNIIFSHKELVEVLEGLEFMAKVEMREFKGKSYPVLIPEAL